MNLNQKTISQLIKIFIFLTGIIIGISSSIALKNQQISDNKNLSKLNNTKIIEIDNKLTEIQNDIKWIIRINIQKYPDLLEDYNQINEKND